MTNVAERIGNTVYSDIHQLMREWQERVDKNPDVNIEFKASAFISIIKLILKEAHEYKQK